jgi:peptide deformylase
MQQSIYLRGRTAELTLDDPYRPMSLAIVHYNSPILRKKGEKVAVFNAELQHLAGDMIDAMHNAHGIGLAAQQVGKALQLFVVDLLESDAEFSWELDGARPPLELFMPMVIINPKVTPEKGTAEKVYEEGCLSFPDIRGDVVRPDTITCKYVDENNVPHILRCNGLFARCIQHENDHINGVLFTDRMDKKVKAALKPEIDALAKQTLEESS